MAEQTAPKNCTRCGAPVDECAFCDDPGCPSILCNRCVRELFLDRVSALPAPAWRPGLQTMQQGTPA